MQRTIGRDIKWYQTAKKQTRVLWRGFMMHNGWKWHAWRNNIYDQIFRKTYSPKSNQIPPSSNQIPPKSLPNIRHLFTANKICTVIIVWTHFSFQCWISPERHEIHGRYASLYHVSHTYLIRIQLRLKLKPNDMDFVLFVFFARSKAF